MNNQYRSAEPGKIRFSITSKLNTKLFFRLLSLFISINILICIISVIALAFYCENKVINALEMLHVNGLPVNSEWMQLAGIDIRTVSESSGSGLFVWPFSERLSYETVKPLRGIRSSTGNARDVLGSINYIVEVSINDTTYEVALRIGQFILYFCYAFLALLALELLTLMICCLQTVLMMQ